MTGTDSPVAQPARARRVRSVSELMPSIGGAAFRRFGFQQSAVVARWREIVGEEYSRHSSPEGLGFPHGKKSGGTLKIAVTGAFAPLLKAVEPQIIERVNRFFGYAAVERLALRHSDLPASATRRRNPVPAPPLSAETNATLRDVADPELRSALESLALALGATRGPPIIR